MTFQQFGEIIEEAPSREPPSFEQFGDVIDQGGQSRRSTRPVGRIAKGTAAGLFGTYGDILDLIRAQPKERLLPGQRSLVEAEEKAPESLLPFLQDEDILPRYSRLPASEEVSEFIEQLGGPGKPETTTQKLLERGPEFVGSLLSLGGVAPARTAVGQAAKTVFRGLAPGAVSVAAEQANLPPWAQAASTIAASIVAHRMSGRSLQEINSETYKRAFAKVPEETRTGAKNLESKAKNLKKALLKGGEAPSEKSTLNFINKALDKIKDGTAEVEELTSLKRSLNEIMLGDEIRKAPKRARTLLKSLGASIDEDIQAYGKQNPQFLKLYREANSAFKGLHEASVIENFVKKHPILAGEGGLILKYLLPSVTVKGAAKGALAVKGAEVASALARNPGLRKLYLRFLKEASKEQVKPALDSLKKFNAAMKKEFPDLE